MNKKPNYAHTNTNAEKEFDKIISSKPVGWEIYSSHLTTLINSKQSNSRFCSNRIATLLTRRDDTISCKRGLWKKIK